jgi:1-pyrroline-5-carboxylate dehydrogenase
MNSHFHSPKPQNVPPCSFVPGTPERALLKEELARQSKKTITIPVIINGEEIYTKDRFVVTAPHDHSLVLAECCLADKDLLQKAVSAAMSAKASWEKLPSEHRLALFAKTAELIEGKYRYTLTAATMLGQSKTAWEAECDSPDELCDLLRYGVYYADQLYSRQPDNTSGVYNRMIYRPLEGFVLAITPFNFASIGGNLPGAPAIMGNTVVWKPSKGSVLSNYYIMKCFMEAGIPAGVINFVPSKGSDVSRYVVSDGRFAGLHFTGSTSVFQDLWKQIGNNIHNYRSYPRLVGETGGKDFLFACADCDPKALVCAMIRGAFEYQGQKCSAISRAYIPESIWPQIKELMFEETAKIKAGDITDFTNFMGAVIDEAAFNDITRYIDVAKASDCAEVFGGNYDATNGWFIEPTIICTRNPNYETMQTELFGPVLTIYIFPDEEFDAAVEHCANSSIYALTGSIFANNRALIAGLEEKLRHAAGNFCINDKPTGALCGQQPFGGARGSGTNDKAGSILNMVRWVSAQCVKENFIPPTDFRYPFMASK